jgi:hypothetical protein
MKKEFKQIEGKFDIDSAGKELVHLAQCMQRSHTSDSTSESYHSLKHMFEVRMRGMKALTDLIGGYIEQLKPETTTLSVAEMEDLIMRKAIETILAAGKTISVFDGGETVVVKSTDPDEIFNALRSTGEDVIRVYGSDGIYDGMIQFIYGNDGYDVIADNSTSLEGLLEPVTKLADELEEKLHG